MFKEYKKFNCLSISDTIDIQDIKWKTMPQIAVRVDDQLKKKQLRSLMNWV